MNITVRQAPDWTLWRSFGAVVETGSLTAAAHTLGLSQPTLGRHIEALEASLGASLFERSLKGLSPNPTAIRLFEQVALANKALTEATLLAEGTNTNLAGTVRITASTVTSHYTLPKILKQLRADYPDIHIELVPSDSPENLLMRESDIAVRMFRPTQLELIAKKLGDSHITCCAHADYLAAKGAPKDANDMAGHDLLGFDRSDLFISGAKALGYEFHREQFQIRTDSQTAMWEMAKAGLGIMFAQTVLVNDAPGMVPIVPELIIPPLEIWLTTHRELFTSRRIRVIYDRLAELLGIYYASD